MMPTIFSDIRQWISSSNSSESQRFFWVYSKKSNKIEWKKRSSYNWFKESCSLRVIFVQMNHLLKGHLNIRTETDKVLLEKLKTRISTCHENFYKKQRLPIVGSIFRFLFGIGLKKAYTDLEVTLSGHINQFNKSKSDTTLPAKKCNAPAKKPPIPSKTPFIFPKKPPIPPKLKKDIVFKNYESKIEHSHILDGKEIGKQVIERYNSVEADILFCKNVLVSIEKLKLQTLDEDKKRELESKENFYQEELIKAEKLKRAGTTWLGSNYFRHLIRQSQSYLEAVTKYFSAPINMRYQKLLIENNEAVGFFRLGIISDMRNGWYSLRDLEKIKLKPDHIDKLIKDLADGKRESGKKGESARYALDQLKGLLVMKGHEKTVSFEKLDKLIYQRRLILEKKALHLVYAHIEKKLKHLKSHPNEISFHLAHLGLLNPRKKTLDSTGWMHDERVEMEDMHEIFKYLNNKKLIFDGTGPFTHLDKLYLPFHINSSEGNRSLTLKTYFFNVSCQGCIENDPIQINMNQQSANALLANFKNEKILDDSLIRYLKGIESIPDDKRGYPIAEKVIVALLKSKKIAVSAGCLSAKDRTGYVGASSVLSFLPVSDRDRMNFRKRIFDEDGPAVKIVQENTPGVKALKMHFISNLEGFSKADKAALLLRAARATAF